MQKVVLVSIRYSLLSLKGRGSWTIGRSNPEEYESSLFSIERLNARLALFKSITLPSLVALNASIPHDLTFKVQLLSSERLPERAKKDLEAAVSPYSFISIQYLNQNAISFKDALRAELPSPSNEICVANVRLDDDDAINKNFIDCISRFLYPQYHGFVVSPSLGYALLVNELGVVEGVKPYRWLFSSAGQSVISYFTSDNKLTSIYECGNHRKVDLKRPVILLSTERTFIRAFHAENDSDATFSGITEDAYDQSNSENAIIEFGLESTPINLKIGNKPQKRK